MNRKRQKPKCPECGAESVSKIVFGYPGEEMMKRSERGEVMLGGCCLSNHDPEWHCKDCGHEWHLLHQKVV